MEKETWKWNLNLVHFAVVLTLEWNSSMKDTLFFAKENLSRQL
jgi:hypothetical protein